MLPKELRQANFCEDGFLDNILRALGTRRSQQLAKFFGGKYETRCTYGNAAIEVPDIVEAEGEPPKGKQKKFKITIEEI